MRLFAVLSGRNRPMPETHVDAPPSGSNFVILKGNLQPGEVLVAHRPAGSGLVHAFVGVHDDRLSKVTPNVDGTYGLSVHAVRGREAQSWLHCPKHGGRLVPVPRGVALNFIGMTAGEVEALLDQGHEFELVRGGQGRSNAEVRDAGGVLLVLAIAALAAIAIALLVWFATGSAV